MTQHPTLHLTAVSCASCGASFVVRSTAKTLTTDVCSNCHPAYTGTQRAMQSGSRIARFNRRWAHAAA